MKILTCLLLFIALNSCHSDARERLTESSATTSGLSVDPSALPVEASIPKKNAAESIAFAPSMMVKEGNLTAEVETLKESASMLLNILAPYKAIITQEHQSRDDYSIRTNYTIRVPAARFDSLMNAIASMALVVDQRDISSVDVAEEYIDIESRIKTKKMYEEKYFHLLQKAKNLSELIEIQNQLRMIREEIESIESRKKYFDSQIAMSTIHLTLYEKRDYRYVEKENGVRYRFKKSISSGWDCSLDIFFGLFSIWPLVILFSIFVLLIRRFYQKKKTN